MHRAAKHKCFYSGDFEFDMSVQTSDSFEFRAKEFIKALESKQEFSIFHNLVWSKPKVLYFVVS